MPESSITYRAVRIRPATSVCSLGTQLSRLYQTVDRGRVLALVLDDMRADPAFEYARVLSFLEIEHDGRTDFPVSNPAITVPVWGSNLIGVLRRAKDRLPVTRRTGLAPRLVRVLGSPGRGLPPPPALLDELRVYFMPEIEILSRLLERDLSHWHSASGPTPGE